MVTVTQLFVLCFAALGLTLALPEPPLTPEEVQLHKEANMAYYLLYQPPYQGGSNMKQCSHLTVSHPTLEDEALAYAHTDGHGPFHTSQGRRALYVSTQVPGDSRLGRKWNLRQQGAGRYDAHLFWRVDGKGAKLLRLDLWKEGAHPQQTMTMQTALERSQPRCSGCLIMA